jgi:hypothetical protein
MDGVVAPVLHNNDPVKPEAVNTELPQLLTTLTAGVATAAFTGAAMPLPGALVHPFTVCVTVYVPAVLTVMDVVVAPVLHNNDPVKPVAVNTELPQLFTTDTAGAAGTAFTVSVAGFELTDPALLVHTARYCLPLRTVVAATVNVRLVAPLIFVHVVPLVLSCHCTVGAGLPVAAELKFTFAPAQVVCEVGCVVTDGTVPPPLVLNTTSTQ